MKFNTLIPKELEIHYLKELRLYEGFLKSRDLLKTWWHLERAHILGQAYPIQHTHVHWLMLKYGFRIKNVNEIIGQIPRLLFGGAKSFIGRIPLGNTGGANVPILMPMQIPEDLKKILNNKNT